MYKYFYYFQYFPLKLWFIVCIWFIWEWVFFDFSLVRYSLIFLDLEICLFGGVVCVCARSLSCVWLFATPWTVDLSLWDLPGKNIRMGCHFLLQGMLLTLELNPRLLHCRWILYHWATWENFGGVSCYLNFFFFPALIVFFSPSETPRTKVL